MSAPVDGVAAEPTRRVPSAHAAYARLLGDHGLLHEYSRLKDQAPAGVYVMPAPGNVRRWHGVIFVRGGHFHGGVFRFTLDARGFPARPPRVAMTPPLFHPLVRADTGELDLSGLGAWREEDRFLVLVLRHLKRALTRAEHWAPRPGCAQHNEEACLLWRTQPFAFVSRARACVEASERGVFAAPASAGAFRFAPHARAHATALRRILGRDDALATALAPAVPTAAAAAAACAPVAEGVEEEAGAAKGHDNAALSDGVATGSVLVFADGEDDEEAPADAADAFPPEPSAAVRAGVCAPSLRAWFAEGWAQLPPR